MGAKRVSKRGIGDLRRRLRDLPRTVAAQVARGVAPAVTEFAGSDYDSGQTVYGSPRPLSADGAPVTLHRTGALRRDVYFKAFGPIIRCVIGPKYAKYMIGRFEFLPIGTASMPVKWRKRLEQEVRTVVPQELGAP